MIKGFLALGMALGIFSASVGWGKDLSPPRPFCSRIIKTEAPKQFRVVTYNTLNLRMAPVGVASTDSGAKTENDIWRLAAVLKASDADIMVLQEVHSNQELQYINKNFLADRFETMTAGGNNVQGMQVGFLIRKNSDLKIEMQNHAHIKWQDKVSDVERPLFLRGAPALVVRNKHTNKVLMVVIGHHAKSKVSAVNDAEGERRRTAEHEGIREIVHAYQSQFGSDVPVIVAGDFNTDLHSSPSTAALHDTLIDSMDMLEDPIPHKDRITHVTFSKIKSNEGKIRKRLTGQLDGILVSKGSKAKVNQAGVYRDAHALPANILERQKQISDHYLVYADIELLE